jgi:hypothetical protein
MAAPLYALQRGGEGLAELLIYPSARKVVLRNSPVGRIRGFVSAASGLLLEEVGYPLGIRRFEKDLRYVLGVRVPCGSDPLDRSIQVIVATPK